MNKQNIFTPVGCSIKAFLSFFEIMISGHLYDNLVEPSQPDYNTGA